jgi:hypothetical protein
MKVLYRSSADLDAPDATFVRPDLTTFARLAADVLADFDDTSIVKSQQTAT